MDNTTYVAFLRGINVGGHKLKMEHLRELLTVFDISNIRTYIQSGNVFFETNEQDIDALGASMERHLHELLGYEVPVFIRTVDQLRATIEAAPFHAMKPTDDTRQLILFYSDTLPATTVYPFVSGDGRFEVLGSRGNDIYLLLHTVNGRSGNVAGFIGKTYGVHATSRFFHTCEKILRAAES